MTEQRYIWRIIMTDGSIRHFPSLKDLSVFMAEVRGNGISYRIAVPFDLEALSSLLNETVDLARLESQKTFLIESKGVSIDA